MKEEHELISAFICAFSLSMAIIIFAIFVIAAIKAYRQPYIRAKTDDTIKPKERTWSEFWKDFWGDLSSGSGGPGLGGY